jgi:hypothetical protein
LALEASEFSACQGVATAQAGLHVAPPMLTRGELKLTGVLSDTLLVFAKPWQWGFTEHYINFP